MKRKHIQVILWTFATLGSLLLLGSQAAPKVFAAAPTGISQAAAVAVGAGTSPGALPAKASAGAVPVPGGMGPAPLTLSCSTAYFGTATNFNVGAYPYGAAVGDFNRDGNLDL